MRMVVVGGAGEVGTAVCRDLADCADVDELVVADRDHAKAEALIQEIGKAHVRAMGIDVTQRASALEVLDGADILMNCASFALFDEIIQLACLAGMNYADLISEPNEAQRERAIEAGIMAISGLGASPGLSNILTRHASEEFDRLDEAHIYWISTRTIAPSRGGLETILWELSDNCPTRVHLHAGRYSQASSFSGARTVNFAPPIGEQQVFHVPHPEVFTLPRNFPSLTECSVRGTWRADLMRELEVLSKYGFLCDDVLDDTKERIWAQFGGERDDQDWVLFVNLEVVGVKNGEAVRRVYVATHPTAWGQEGMGRMTGTCAAVGAQLMARHGANRPGFVDPEVYYDPHEFLRELKNRETVTVTHRELASGSTA